MRRPNGFSPGTLYLSAGSKTFDVHAAEVRPQQDITRLGLPGTGTPYGKKRWATSAAVAAATFILDFRALFN